MRILILNWRDIKNPKAGGAELLTQEVAKRWVAWGNQVWQISANFPGGKNYEVIEGVKIIRLGRWWSVHLLAFFYYLRNLRGKVDIIIDEVHWFPFFARLYAKNKTVLLACEVANKLFYKLFPPPLAFLGRLFEKVYLFLYRQTPTLAISPSTKKDLIKEGFNPQKITVLPMGVSFPSELKIFPKEKKPTVIYLGRLDKQKGIEEAIEVFYLVKKEIPESKFWVVGAGRRSYVRKIKEKVKNFSLEAAVIFFGFVKETKKFELLSRAHLLIVPSFQEGWGLVVPEAGVVGTPAVVYNVAGLRDIVKKGINGLVVKPAPKAMAKAVVKILKDKKSWQRFSLGAIKEAKRYNWENTAGAALQVARKVMKDEEN